MPRWQRVYACACAGVIAYALTYVVVDYAAVPHPVYDPLGRRFGFAGRASGVAMGYYGAWLYAVGAAAVVVAVAALVVARRRAPATGRTLGLLAAWAGTAWFLGVAYYAWMNWP